MLLRLYSLLLPSWRRMFGELMMLLALGEVGLYCDFCGGYGLIKSESLLFTLCYW